MARVLRRGLRDGEDRRHLAVLARRGRRDLAMPGVPATASCSFVRSASLPASPLGMSIARRNGPLEPGAERLAQAVVGDRWGLASGWLPSSGWPRRSWVTGRGEEQHDEHAGGDREPRLRGDDLAPAAEGGRGRDVLGLLGRRASRRAPIMTSRTVSADTTTAPTAIAARQAELADERDPDHEQAGDREHHDQAGGDHGRAGGRRGLRRRVAAAVARGDLLPVAPDDQQRVVDARAEAEHDRDHRRERRQAERLRPAPPAGSGRSITPISAPSSVASIAARSGTGRQSRMIAMPMPTSSPTGGSCSEPRSISDAARGDLDAVAAGALRAASISASPSAFRSRSGRVL